MNLNNYKIVSIILILLGFLTLSFFAGRCTKPAEIKKIPVTIKIPEIKGKSEIIRYPKPYEIIKDSIVYKDSIVFKENQELIERFQKIETEKEKLQTYIKSIELKKYNIPFEDDNIKTNSVITTRGEILSFEQKYEIKSKELNIDVPIKETKLAIYAGGGLYYNTENQKAAYKLGGGLQNKKGDIVDVTYDPINKTVFVDYKFRIFNYKK